MLKSISCWQVAALLEPWLVFLSHFLPRVSVKRHQLLAGSSNTRALADSSSHFLPRVSVKRHQLLAGSSFARTLAGLSYNLLPRVSVKRHQLLAGSSDTRALADSMSHFLPRAGGKKTFVAYCWYLSGNLSSVKCACETTKMKRHLFLTAFLSPFWLVVRIIIAIIDTVHHQRRWNISVKFLKRK